MSAHVASIHRYPVKSMLGEQLGECAVTAGGLVGDRAYALLDADDGIVASAKNPRKWAGLLEMSASFVAEPQVGQVPPPVLLTLPGNRVLRSDDDRTDEQLSAALGRSVRLITEHPGEATFEEVWPEIDGLAPAEFIEQTRTGTSPSGEAISTMPLGLMAPPRTFFDLAVLHLITTSTLAQLGELAPGGDFDPRRYRPNLLISDDRSGFVEDAWVGAEADVGAALRISVSMFTMRCVMTTLRQRDLAADPTTLRTLARHHRKQIPGLGTWACAGVYAGVVTEGTVRVDDPFTIC